MAVILLPSVIPPPVAEKPVCVDFLPEPAACWQTCRMRKKVVVLVQDGVEPFGLGAMCEVWAEPYHPEDDNPVFDFVVATPRPGRVRGPSGFDLHVEHGLDAAADADLVCVAPKRDYLDPSPEVAAVVAAAHAAGRVRLRPLHRRLRAGRGRTARRPALHHPLASRRRPGRAVPRGARRRERPLRPGRHDRDRGRLRRRPRRRPAPDAPAVRRPHRRERRPADGGAAPPRRRSGAVHRPTGPRLRRRDARSAADLDRREPRRRPQRRRAGPPAQPHVAAHLRAPVPRRDRHDPARLGHPASGSRRPRSCSSSPTTPSTGSPARSASATPPPCATTSPARAG